MIIIGHSYEAHGATFPIVATLALAALSCTAAAACTTHQHHTQLTSSLSSPLGSMRLPKGEALEARLLSTEVRNRRLRARMICLLCSSGYSTFAAEKRAKLVIRLHLRSICLCCLFGRTSCTPAPEPAGFCSPRTHYAARHLPPPIGFQGSAPHPQRHRRPFGRSHPVTGKPNATSCCRRCSPGSRSRPPATPGR